MHPNHAENGAILDGFSLRKNQIIIDSYSIKTDKVQDA